MLHNVVRDLGCVSSRILWIKFKFSKVKAFVVGSYSPNKGNDGEKERFWNDFERIVDRVGNGYRLCILGDLNEWIVDRVSDCITFGVPGDNEWWMFFLCRCEGEEGEERSKVCT